MYLMHTFPVRGLFEFKLDILLRKHNIIIIISGKVISQLKKIDAYLIIYIPFDLLVNQ